MGAGQQALIINPYVFRSGGPTGAADDFNRADAGALGTSSGGQLWTQQAGTIEVLSNEAHITGTAAINAVTGAIATVDSGLANCAIEYKITAGAGNDHWLVFRFVDANNFYYLNWFAAFGWWRTTKQVAGVQSQGHIAGPAGGFSNGDVVKLVLSGSTLNYYKNGSQFDSDSDAFNGDFLTATKHGIGGSSTNCKFDDFSIVP